MLYRSSLVRTSLFLLVLGVILSISATSFAQSTSTLRGNVTDQSGAVVPNAKVTARNQATGIERSTQTDTSGNYQIAALPVGTYDVQVSVPGMSAQNAKGVVLPVSQIVAMDFKVGIQKAAEVVTVTGEAPAIESSTITVGQVIDERTVQEIPLNGRHFVDLGLLIPGSVTPPPMVSLPRRFVAKALRLQHRRTTRRHRQLHDQWREPERHGAEPDHIPAVDQHRFRIQGGQLHLQRGIRP